MNYKAVKLSSLFLLLLSSSAIAQDGDLRIEGGSTDIEAAFGTASIHDRFEFIEFVLNPGSFVAPEFPEAEGKTSSPDPSDLAARRRAAQVRVNLILGEDEIPSTENTDRTKGVK